MSSDKKRVIIMQPGPIHLFWTTGVFYFWQLKDRFDFAFIVPSSYLECEDFQKLLELPAVRHVEYLAPAAILWRHVCYRKQFRRVLKDFPPTYLLLHNTSYPENQYLIHFARKLYPKSPRYHYQNGRMALMWESDFAARRSIQVESIYRLIPRISHLPRLTSTLVNMRNYLSYFANLKIIPLINVARTFSPPVNVYNGEVNVEAAKSHYEGKYDKIFSYLDIEAQAYRDQGAQNVVVVQHPMLRRGDEVFRFLFGDFIVKNQIVIFPSYGFTSSLIESGWDEVALVNHISGRWFDAIQSLLIKFPTYDVKIKLHPASHADRLWQKIVIQLQLRSCSKLEVIESKVSAEFLVAQSRVIAGDVTSVLWWAALYGNKTVVSFDIFGYVGGNEMQLYKPHINYVSNLSEDIAIKSRNNTVESRDLIDYLE